MNKIHKLIFTIVCLLTTLGSNAYKIEQVKATNGSIDAIKYGSSAMAVNVNDTDIPTNETVTMTVMPNIGYYLSALEYEEVTSLDEAMAPRRADKIQPVHQITVNTINATYIAAHYGGTYSFTMPRNNVIIRATFSEATNVLSAITLTWDNGATTMVYNGYSHGINVKHGETTLTAGTHYNSNLTSQKDVYDNNPVITGCGRYFGTHNTTNLKITPALLTVTADNKSKEYLDANPALTVSYSGFQGSDNENENNCLTTAPVLTTTATESSPASVSTYPITFSTDAVAPNYSITQVNGNLTITSRNIGTTSTKGQAVITLSKEDDEGFFNTNQYFKHTGSVQTPTVTVKYGENTLGEGISNDYTLTTTGHYTDATDKSKPDIYTITVTFKGNYTGSKTVEYQIRPKVTLNSSYRWMTYLEPVYNMEIPNSYKFSAHTVSGISTTSVTLTDRTQIRANVPMLLYRTGTTEETVFYPPLIKTPTDSWSGLYANYLWNSTEKAINTLISEHSNMDIWILVNDQFVRTKSGTLPANRGYLLKEKATGGGSSAPAMLPLVRGSENTTGVELIINNPIDNGDWYTLDGRKLQGRPTQKGVYINQGKKIYIK